MPEDFYTLAETYTLPSGGLIYGKKINPEVKIRSMTTVEEMRRLSHTDTPYKTLCDIIDACIVNDIGISSYDMHLGDYQFLLHRLRVVTYGSNYPSSSMCPICGTVNKVTLDLDKLKLKTLDEDSAQEYLKLFDLELPRTKKKLKLKFTTPRDLDEVEKEEKEYMAENPEEKLNMDYLFSLMHLIKTVDGKVPNPILLRDFLKKLPLMDTNAILQREIKINNEVGIDTTIENKCSNSKCGAKYKTSFRITSEFFGPTEY